MNTTIKYITAYLLCLCGLLYAYKASASSLHNADKSEVLNSSTVRAEIKEGLIVHLAMKDNSDKWHDIDFYNANDTCRGPMWVLNGKDVKWTKKSKGKYVAEATDGVLLKLYYSIQNGAICISAEATNVTRQNIYPHNLGIRLGINTYMTHFNEFKNLYFPTLLRCEQTHLWGYFETPMQKVLGIAVTAPVASYRLHYAGNGHRIRTVTLDLLHQKPLPSRHPQTRDVLKAGETLKWNIYLTPVDSVSHVKSRLAKLFGLPMIDALKYTIAQGERIDAEVLACETPRKITITSPNGNIIRPVCRQEQNRYCCSTGNLNEAGVYKMEVTQGEYCTQALFSVRKPWNWYMSMAKKACVEHPAKGADCCESWYGLYSGLLGQKYERDVAMDANIFEQFDNIYNMTYDARTGWPRLNIDRIQNHATTCGMLVDKYEVTKDTVCLLKAGALADFLISRQDAKGAYIGPSGDYTCVIYPAKSIMELMEKEKELSIEYPGSLWSERYRKHAASVKRAMDNVIRVDGDFHTEGQQTYEDGTYSCGAAQLSQFALLQTDSVERRKYTDAALRCIYYHQALEQEIIPDSRINGGSLRFWEAQYDVLLKGGNMMNSPHGWTAWSIYGMLNLYELTGNIKFLQKGMNALGSCVQLMDFDGHLRWGFVADPYREVELFVHDAASNNPWGAGKYVPAVIGESYVDMITDWFRTPPGMDVRGYLGQGGSCDNDVHEVFKAMEEVALTKAYVAQRPDGSFLTYNCKAALENNVLQIKVTEKFVNKVHINCKTSKNYNITFCDGVSHPGTISSIILWIKTLKLSANTKNNCIFAGTIQ